MGSDVFQHTQFSQDDVAELVHRLTYIASEYQKDWEQLYSQGLLTEIDTRKIQNQVEVTKKALFQTISATYFPDDVRSTLINRFVSDFQQSIETIIYQAIARQNIERAIAYKLDKIDEVIIEAIRSRRTEGRLADRHEYEIRGFMRGARVFLIQSSVRSNQGWLKSQQAPPDELIKNYQEQVTKLLQQRSPEISPTPRS